MRGLVVEHAGHMAMLERPAQVNHEIRVFARRALGLDRVRGARRKAIDQKTTSQKTASQKTMSQKTTRQKTTDKRAAGGNG